MCRRELDVVPQGVQSPAVKIVELSQQADLAVLGDGIVDDRHEGLVVRVVAFAGHSEADDVAGAFGALLDHGSCSERLAPRRPGDRALADAYQKNNVQPSTTSPTRATPTARNHAG